MHKRILSHPMNNSCCKSYIIQFWQHTVTLNQFAWNVKCTPVMPNFNILNRNNYLTECVGQINLCSIIQSLLISLSWFNAKLKHLIQYEWSYEKYGIHCNWFFILENQNWLPDNISTTIHANSTIEYILCYWTLWFIHAILYKKHFFLS